MVLEGYSRDMAIEAIFQRRRFNKDVRDTREIGWLTAMVAMFILVSVLIAISI